MATTVRFAAQHRAACARPGQPLRAAPRITCMASTSSSKTKTRPGFRWDGSMMRWVRDDRFQTMENIVVQPKTGVAYTVWPVIYAELLESNIQGVDAQEAARLQQQGWTLVDVRIGGDFDKGHIEGSINVPLFRLVAGNEFWDKVKKAVMAGLAMAATERDPNFKDKLLAAVRKNSKVIFVCAIGGTLDTKINTRPDKYKEGYDKDPDRNFGRESRSLKAAHEALKAGWSGGNVKFLVGGYQQWRYDGFPVSKN